MTNSADPDQLASLEAIWVQQDKVKGAGYTFRGDNWQNKLFSSLLTKGPTLKDKNLLPV